MKKRPSRKKKKDNDNIKLVYLFIAVVIGLTGILYLIAGRGNHIERTPFSSLKPEKPADAPLSQPPDSTREEWATAPSLPKLAVIIDDIGFNRRFSDLIEINVPITLAVIPFTPYSLEAASKGNLAGMEVMLHFPMEPKGYPASDPGKGALLISMSREAILGQTIASLNAIPNIKGVNNHMGSSFTEYSEGMEIVLSEIKKRNLFFVDSKTSMKSTGYSLSKSMDIRTAERNIFLDNVQTEEAITHQLMEAVKVAKHKGQAVAIGHPYPETVNVLKRLAPGLKDKGIDLVFASDLAR